MDPTPPIRREPPAPPRGRDRLRELLDAVLADEHHRLGDMAGGAYSSPYHLSRRLTREVGEPPVALRRRVMLERAAWQLRGGSSVTAVAFEAGYDSVEGFSRAFGRAYGYPPSDHPTAGPAQAHWLPAPNGIHFHPPTSLWVDAQDTPADARGSSGEVTALLVHHDVDDTRRLLVQAHEVDDDAYRRARLEGLTVLAWDGPEGSLAAVLDHLVWAKEVWVASILGEEHPSRGADDPASLLARHDKVAPRWLGLLRDLERRGAWQDRIVDALCEPPESFVVGSVVAHVLTYAAHRRLLARHLLRAAGHAADAGDPIEWLRSTHGSGPTASGPTASGPTTSVSG